MQLLRWTVTFCLILGLAGCGVSTTTKLATSPSSTKPEPKPQATNKDKIVGTWEVAKSDEIPPGTVFEFTKDGKMKMSMKMEGKTVEMEGTYEVEGETLKSVGKGPDGKEDKNTDTIVKLTDTELVIKNPKIKKPRSQMIEFKKKK